jgi:hypothetical protein
VIWLDETQRDYKEYIGLFLIIEKKNGRIAKGILKGFTADGKLKVKGDYLQWVISPESIQDITVKTCQGGR